MHITVLFLHERRIHDLSIWLRSLEKTQRLSVLLLISKQTERIVGDLTKDSIHQFEVSNIDGRDKEHDLSSQRESTNQLVNFFREVRFAFSEYRRFRTNARQILSQHQDTVLVTYDDRMPSIIAILDGAHALDIPIFLPSLLTANPDRGTQTANILKPQRFIERLLVRLLGPFLPNQMNQENRLYFDPTTLVVLLWHRTLPTNPWAKGSLALIDCLGVESRLIHDRLIDYGISGQRMRVTGLPIYDFLDFSATPDTSEKPDKPVLLLALPQYAEHGAMTIEGALTIIRPLLESLTHYHGKVVVSLHPRMKLEDYEATLSEFPFEYTTGGVNEWLKKCAVFVSTNSSSTIYWALMLGIPTILLNHVYPKSDLFRDFDSLRYVEEDVTRELPDLINTLPDNHDVLIKEDQDKLSKPLVSDGNFGGRNVEILQQLSQRNQVG